MENEKTLARIRNETVMLSDEQRLAALTNESREVTKIFDSVKSVNTVREVKDVLPSGFPEGDNLSRNDMYFFRVERLSFDEDFPRREAFENVLVALDSPSYNFVYVLTGSEKGIELCVGVVKNQSEKESVFSTQNYGDILMGAFNGNFNGSVTKPLMTRKIREGKRKGETVDELAEKIINACAKYENAGVITGIPSVNEKEAGDTSDFQGIDRLINSMQGTEWRLVVVCEPVEETEVDRLQQEVYAVYNQLSLYAKQSVQYSQNRGASFTKGKNSSTTDGTNAGYNESDSTSSNHSSGDEFSSTSRGSSHQTGWNKGENHSETKGENSSWSGNKGESASVTMEKGNKHAAEMMKYIDDELLERMKLGRAKGLFKTSVYYMAEKPTVAERLKTGIISLFQGNKSTFSPLYAQKLDMPEKDADRIEVVKKMLRTYQNHSAKVPTEIKDSRALSLLSRPFNASENALGLNTYLTAQEVSLFAGLPMKEVSGLPMKESVDFGLNEKPVENGIHLGYIMQKGREIKALPFMLAPDSMNKHVFIAGTTGGGKTTTCHKLLKEVAKSNVPFLVIEPAKTEYRTLINGDKDIVVFTLGNERCAPFRINPFEIIDGEIISSHIDMVKATFTSAFPMEASMPQLLEEAIIKCYEKKGWDINTNSNSIYENPFDQNVDAFPTMSDLLAAMPEVVKEKGFSAQMKGDYEGSLISRLSNLTKGSKGAMLDCEHSINFDFIAKNKVIIEMEEVKSPEDKALLMGFVLARLTETIKSIHKSQNDFQHITLIEEAHRLLSKPEPGDSGAKKSAVETFADLLAEVRKYGEGLIVVDQIPNKLAAEVLKNTNTKIIHKIFAKDDKEAVGDTMLMDDKQKEFLSALEIGEAIVFNEHTSKPVHVKVKAITNTNEKAICNEIVYDRFCDIRKNARQKIGCCYDDLEVCTIYSKYETVAEKFAKLEIIKKDCDELSKSVKRVSKLFSIDEKDAWRMLIKKYDIKSGKAQKSSVQQETRIEDLVDFFCTDFCKADFSAADLTNNKYTDGKSVCLYLK